MPTQLPHFIQDQLVHFNELHLSHKRRSTIALLTNLSLYETNRKEVLNSIDLQNTVLEKVQNKLQTIVPVLNGIQSLASDILGSSIACPSQTVGGIVIGKYIYQNCGKKKVYLLLKCWDLLVVIRSDLDGFALQAEYEHVRSFKMRKGNSYQVDLEISFIHGVEDIVTNFQENRSLSAVLQNTDAYRNTLNKIKMKQSELLVHKIITRKEFVKLRSTDLFGCNYLRTPRLEEMQILSKCGDAWKKVTADDDIVIGVPLVNNSSTRLTVLRNFRAVLSCHGNRDFNYNFTLCQLNKGLRDVESIHNFFQNQDDDNPNKYSWSQCTELYLRPEAFYVLVIRIKMHALCELDVVQLPLFVFYDIVVSERTFSQKCFVTTLSFRGIFSNESCRLNFNQKHLHRDLLTVITTSFEAETVLEYKTNGVILEDYLCSKLGFFRISHDKTSSETMNIDGQDENNDITPEKVFFYNKNCDSIWHGTLLAITYNSVSFSDVKLYTKTQQKSNVFFGVLQTELKIKFGIKEIRRGTRNLSYKLIGFEAALRDECYSYLEMCSNRAMKMDRINISKKLSLQKDLYLNELNTDILFRLLES